MGRKRRMNKRENKKGGTEVMMSCPDFEPGIPLIGDSIAPIPWVYDCL